MRGSMPLVGAAASGMLFPAERTPSPAPLADAGLALGLSRIKPEPEAAERRASVLLDGFPQGTPEPLVTQP